MDTHHADPYAQRMSPAYPPRILLALALTGCTAAAKDDSTGEAASTTSSTTSAESGTAATPASTGSDDTSAPTTAGPTSTTGTTDTPDTTGAPDTTDTTVPAVSFTDIYEQVLLPNGCNAGYCHGGSAGGLEMTDEATSYANLVEVTAVATLCDQTTRVVPGSLAESVLWYRVRPSALDADSPCADGSKMPKMSMGLSEAQAQLVSDWIVGGALE